MDTVVGSGPTGSRSGGFRGDGGLATSARLNGPTGVAVDDAGNLYIADQGNHRIRLVTTGGLIATVAGTGRRGYSLGGGLAVSAQLSSPSAVAVDTDGNLYIADTGNNRIRKVTPEGLISTIAGTGTKGFSGDGGPATAAELHFPTGVAVDADGNIYIADQLNHRIRKLVLAAPMQLSILSGDGQNAPAATVLPRPLVVKVVGPDGAPLPEVEVSFSVISGSAKLSATSTITDVDGRAGVGVTLGNALGGLAVAASVNGLQPVVFTLTATATSAKGEPLPAQKTQALAQRVFPVGADVTRPQLIHKVEPEWSGPQS